ncbi:MAG: carboxypeptidase, partial [Candidatus Marinimicrobia bacterium]|nr:carboxypeptidase [Candidatus Neomarinimicrobiota bacterium]
DSFFSWGFFLEILQRAEYVEGYVMEPLAERMLTTDPGLRRKFEAALKADKSLADDPQARLQWLYRKTPYYDDRHLLYPVGRER